jgi:hypothetical protein
MVRIPSVEFSHNPMCAGVQIARLSLTFSPNIAQEKTGHLLLFAESSPTQTILSTYPT